MKAEAEYLKPVSFGETIDISSRPSASGRSRSRSATRAAASSDGVIAFVVRNTVVAVHMDRWQSVPIPAHHRKGFESIRATPAAS